MSKLSQFLGKKESVFIDGVEFVINPLTVNDLPLFLQIDQEDVEGSEIRLMQNICRKIVRENFPEATEEELGMFPVMKLMPAVTNMMGGLTKIMEGNGRKEDQVKNILKGASGLGEMAKPVK